MNGTEGKGQAANGAKAGKDEATGGKKKKKAKKGMLSFNEADGEE